MCGRYTLTKPLITILKHFKTIGSNVIFERRFNIAPTQFSPVVIISNRGFILESFRWGLIPYWANDSLIGNKLINARAETIDKKPSFKNSFRNRRCLIPADGFYEWQSIGKQKNPHYIYLKQKRLFAFAGIWADWQLGKEAIRSFCIITTEANASLSVIHHRMPVILPVEHYKEWLNPGTSAEQLHKLLLPFPLESMKYHPVSKAVNSPRNDFEGCLEMV